MASTRQVAYITSLFEQIQAESADLGNAQLAAVENLIRPIYGNLVEVLGGVDIDSRLASSMIDDLLKAKNLLPTVPLTAEQNAAIDWAGEHTEDGFLASLLAQYNKKKSLTPAQWKALIQTFRERSGVAVKASDGVRRVDLSSQLDGVADGFYAVDSATGNNDLDFWVVTTNQGRRNPANKGKRWLYRFIGGTGRVNVTPAERTVVADMLRELPEEERLVAQARFGQEIGSCGRCGRPLTDVVSRYKGLGPDCRGKLGVHTDEHTYNEAIEWATGRKIVVQGKSQD